MTGSRTLRIAELADKVFDGPFGSNLKSSDYTASGTRVVRLENIGHRRFIAEKESFISNEKAEGLARHRLLPGDVLFSSFVEDQSGYAFFRQSYLLLQSTRQIASASVLTPTLSCPSSWLSSLHLAALLRSCVTSSMALLARELG